MNQEKTEHLIRVFHLKYSLPVLATIISVYFWIHVAGLHMINIVGIAINVVGLVMWWVAKLTLAQNWNVGFGRPKITQLVTSGIYARISHPMYWGINLTFLGLVLVSPTIWLVLVSLIIIAYFFHRMKVENRYLSEKLGDEYLDYRKKTWI